MIRSIGFARLRWLLFGLAWVFPFVSAAAPPPSGVASEQMKGIRALVAACKADPRGPYQGIRWFCPDGTVLPAQQRCPDPGGLQHALLKDDVAELAQSQKIYLGQILAGTPLDAFLNADDGYARLKQYQIEAYLQRVDDGWIHRGSRTYRGAFQAEDEADWGERFLIEMLSDDARVRTRFLLCREACRDIPHGAGDSRWPQIRALAKTIADSVASFADLRVKIHGRPDSTDLSGVRAFSLARAGVLSSSVNALLENLEQAMSEAYAPPNMSRILSHIVGLDPALPMVADVKRFASRKLGPGSGAELAHLIRSVRVLLPQVPKGRRLGLMDLSIELEEMLFRWSATANPTTLDEHLEQIRILGRASAGAGYLEEWEWERIRSSFALTPGTRLTLHQITERSSAARRLAGWGASMFRAVYGDAIDRFQAFEPLSAGFIDDRIRSTVLLPLGDAAAALAARTSARSGQINYLAGLSDPSGAFGLNPGYATGELAVHDGPPEAIDYNPNRIYLLHRPPGDLKPVAGIATVTDGNCVSHVQLLARNLGIPNAVISPGALRALAPLNGRRVFYAVSPGGAVVLKAEADMTESERGLFTTVDRPEDLVRVPVDRIEFGRMDLPDLLEVRAGHSGVLCGPKAANLGELRSLFPDRVAPGLVVPFAVFRQHLDQPVVEGRGTYWEWLGEIFKEYRSAGNSQQEREAAETWLLEDLAELRKAVRQIPLLPGFVDALDRRAFEIFGSALGDTPLFVRSDTNMEDLKDFTGAGLNLTVPNVRSRAALHQAIRDVWASPYSERSYRWRQKFLQNPEDVYPSILLLRSVNVEKSGVMITAGVTAGGANDLTVAFNRGVGGAVDGQSAESYLLKEDDSDLLLSPAREPAYNVLPESGGVAKASATFERPVLSWADRSALRQQGAEIRSRLASKDGEASGPFDVELGILDGEVGPFQVRPFVENRRARSSSYLRELDAVLPDDVSVGPDEEL